MTRNCADSPKTAFAGRESRRRTLEIPLVPRDEKHRMGTKARNHLNGAFVILEAERSCAFEVMAVAIAKPHGQTHASTPPRPTVISR